MKSDSAARRIGLCLALAAAACGSKPPPTEEPVTPSAEPPTASGSAASGTCPTISLSEAGHTAKGTPLEVKASLQGGDAAVAPTFNWTVSAGAIEEGQGTDRIVIGTGEVDGNLTITVEVGGYDAGCAASASTTTHVM